MELGRNKTRGWLIQGKTWQENENLVEDPVQKKKKKRTLTVKKI